MIGEIKWWIKTIKSNKPDLISTNPTFQAVIITDVFLIAWGATFQAVNQIQEKKWRNYRKKRKISRFYQKKVDCIAQQT
jgi:ABC-type Fe2+-enterobactin transport system substrate-binding protein